MTTNDKKLYNSQNQTDSQIKAKTKNKHKTLQVLCRVLISIIINSVEKLE